MNNFKHNCTFWRGPRAGRRAAPRRSSRSWRPVEHRSWALKADGRPGGACPGDLQPVLHLLFWWLYSTHNGNFGHNGWKTLELFLVNNFVAQLCCGEPQPVRQRNVLLITFYTQLKWNYKNPAWQRSSLDCRYHTFWALGGELSFEHWSPNFCIFPSDSPHEPGGLIFGPFCFEVRGDFYSRME